MQTELWNCKKLSVHYLNDYSYSLRFHVAEAEDRILILANDSARIIASTEGWFLDLEIYSFLINQYNWKQIWQKKPKPFYIIHRWLQLLPQYGMSKSRLVNNPSLRLEGHKLLNILDSANKKSNGKLFRVYKAMVGKFVLAIAKTEKLRILRETTPEISCCKTPRS